MTSTDGTRATPGQVIAFFSEGSHKLGLQEIKALKAGDPKAYDQIAEGIGNGTLTY